MAAEAQYTVPLLINGEERTTTTTFSVVSPASHKAIWTSSSASLSDATDAVAAAQSAFPSWSKTKPAYRRTILLKAADIMQERAQECRDYIMQETGAGALFVKEVDIPGAVEMLRDVAGRISGVCGAVPVCAAEGTSALVFKEPYGVVLGIAPWNAPYILGVRAFLFAVAAGNTCVLKGPEISPRTYWAIGSILTAAGLPPGVLNIIFHRPSDAAEITTALIEHPAVRKVNFTGSTPVGRIIAATAGRVLKPVVMELGGKASAIVLDDADLEKAATACALGAFLNCGQVCMSTERIVVQSAILEKFTAALKSAVSNIFGEDTPAPVLVASAGVDKNKRLIDDAIKAGAKVLHGDHEVEERHPETKEVSKTRMRPIIVGGVHKEMELYHTESFGPSVSLIEVQTEEEAIQVANDTEYGLSGAVFTESLARGLRVAKQIDSGAVHINAMTIHDEANLPHGGVKASGWGRFNGNWGIEEFLKVKTVTYQD